MHFIDFCVVETKRLVGSTLNVILTRQTCGQTRAGLRKANAERWEIIFSGEFDRCSQYQNVEETEIQVCVQLRDVRVENRNTVATSGEKTRFNAGKIGICHCAVVLQTQVPKLCTNLDLGLLYVLISGTYNKFGLENNFLSLGRFPPQDHVYKTTDESFRFHNKTIDEIRCKLDSTENPRSFEKYPSPP